MAAAQPTAPQSADEVAAMFGRMTVVSDEFSRQLDLIATAPQPLSQITVEVLTRLLAIVQPAAKMREQMATLPPALLMAGIQAWMDREGSGLSVSARDRAARAWTAGGAR